MKEVKYNPFFLDVVRDLSKISPRILFIKNEETVAVRQKENEIAFQIKASDGAFDFEGEKLGFLDYAKFHDLYKIFKNPSINQTEDHKIHIQAGGNKISFLPSNPDLIKNTFNRLGDMDDVLIFDLTKEKLKDITQMIGKINPGANGSAYVTVQMKNGVLKLILSNKVGPNTFETVIEVANKEQEDIEVKFNCDILSKVPSNDYVVSISESSITMEHRNVNYELILRTGLHYEDE